MRVWRKEGRLRGGGEGDSVGWRGRLDFFSALLPVGLLEELEADESLESESLSSLSLSLSLSLPELELELEDASLPDSDFARWALVAVAGVEDSDESDESLELDSLSESESDEVAPSTSIFSVTFTGVFSSSELESSDDVGL